MSEKENGVLFTTEEENLKNRIRFLESELSVIKEKVKVLARVPPFTIRIDAATKQLAEDILKYINDIPINEEWKQGHVLPKDKKT